MWCVGFLNCCCQGKHWLGGQPSGRLDASYVRQVVTADFSAAVVAAVAAVGARFGVDPKGKYLVLSLVLPLLWVIALRVFGGYEWRFLVPVG